MKKLSKAIAVILMFTALSTRLEAQTPYRQYAEDGVMLNFLGIDNVDFRVYLLYNINMDDRFNLIPESEYGRFVLTSAYETDNFIDKFESFYQSVSNNFAMLTKYDIFEHLTEWKSGIPSKDFLSITMDIALRNSRVDNDHCINSNPFCTSDLIEFEAACTSQTANEPGMDDGCIGSSYNPSWYHMRIHTGGQFIIHMVGVDPTNGTHRDIDFCMWGPYTEEDVSTGWACSHLSSDKIIDCCYSPYYTEDAYLGYPEDQHSHGESGNSSHGTIHVHTPEVGEYYILMITNFSQQPCVISFTKAEDSGPGTTDCGILPGNASNDGPYCEGETINLHVTGQSGATYHWAGPNHFSSNEQNPTLPNCTPDMAGEYTCTIVVGSQSTSATTIVEIYQQPIPSFTSTTVCQGQPTEFIGQASGSNVANYEWDFGDGETGSGQNIHHIYNQAGTYQVTFSVSAEDGSCPAEITQTVTVDAMPNAGDDELVTTTYGGTAPLTGSGGSGNFTYHWEPADMVVNPDAQNTQTVVLTQGQVYTLTITNPIHPECTDSKQVTVRVEGGALSAIIEATPDALCLGSSTQLTVSAFDGTGHYTYSWEHNPSLNSATITVTPTTTTEYVCNVTDGQTTWPVRVTVTVNMPKTLDPVHISGECDVYSGIWIDEQGNEQPFEFHENTVRKFEGFTDAGCHLEQTYYIEAMEYTPQPSHIFCTDEGAIVSGDTIFVVTNTEFFSFQYNFKIEETEASVWDSCVWIITKPSWTMDVLTNKPNESTCRVYVADRDEKPVNLICTTYNGCNPDGVVNKFFLKSSFLGIDEVKNADVSIIPNPNNGQMRIDFENMEGRTYVKVFDMTGNQIDAFETNIRTSSYSYEYTMKQYADGIYFFVFSNDNRLFTRRVVIIQ